MQPPVDMQLVDRNRAFWYNGGTAKAQAGVGYGFERKH